MTIKNEILHTFRMEKHKQQILQVLERETAVCKRLFTLIPKEMIDYAPKEGMRTTLELLRYMTWCAGSCVESYMETDAERLKGIYGRNEEYGDTMRFEDFPVRMDEQMTKITMLLDEVTDEILLEKKVNLPWREQMTLGAAIMETSLKWLTGYKMQLFLYMRIYGLEVDTGDCWIMTG